MLSLRFATISLVIILLSLPACGKGTKKPPPASLGGTIVMMGNEPFTKLTVQTDKGNYIIEGKQKATLRGMQNEKVRVHGKLTADDADGIQYKGTIYVDKFDRLSP